MRRFVPLLALAVVAFSGAMASAQGKARFGAIEPMAPEAARAKAEAWLKEVGKGDAATLARLETIWKQDRTVLDRLVDSFALGSDEVHKLMNEARTPSV